MRRGARNICAETRPCADWALPPPTRTPDSAWGWVAGEAHMSGMSRFVVASKMRNPANELSTARVYARDEAGSEIYSVATARAAFGGVGESGGLTVRCGVAIVIQQRPPPVAHS